MPSDIFISYRRKDSARVLPLVAALRDEGISPWLDQRAIGEFAPITDDIRKGLAESKALLAGTQSITRSRAPARWS
jgi:TIR domain